MHRRRGRAVGVAGAGIAAIAMIVGSAVPAGAAPSDSPTSSAAVESEASDVDAVDEGAPASESAAAAEPSNAQPSWLRDVPATPTVADVPAPGVDADAPGAVSSSSPQAAAGELVSLTPARLLESREGQDTVDDEFAGEGRVDAGETVELAVVGRGGVPADAVSAVVINVTAVFPSGAGFVTVFPCGDQPLASSLNFDAPGAIVGNEVIAKVSSDGTVCMFSSTETHLTVDVTGYVPAGSSVTSLEPARLLETREGQDTIDDDFAGEGTIGAGETLRLDVVGRGGVPASGVSAAVMNVTAILPAAAGFITVFPCGDQPLASSLNFDKPGAIAGNEVVAKLADDGTVCLFSSTETHLAVDVTGYVPDSSTVTSLDPARLLETREGQDTIDGGFAGEGTIEAGETITLDVVGRGGVPADAVSAAVMNVTAILPTGPGFVTVFPCGDQPLASSLNFDAPGAIVGNEVVAKLNDAGQVCMFSSTETHLAVDVTGYVPVPNDVVAEPSVTVEEGWRFEPNSITFTAADETETVRLVHYGSDGEPSGRALPDGTELGFSNQTFDVERTDEGFVVQGDDAIGSTLVIARLPDGTALRMWISGVRLVDGVVELVPEQVVLPPPDGVTVTDLGAFTPSELEERTAVDPDGPIWNPVVLSGEVPPTGTIVMAAGEAPVVGRIVEPPGAPTLVRGQLTMVTLEILALDEMYERLDVRADIGDLSSDGFIDSVGETFCYGASCAAPGAPLGGTVDSIAKIAAPIQNQTGLSTCAAPPEPGATFGEVKFVFETNATPIGNFDAVVNGPNQTRINFQFGIDFSVKAGIEGKAAIGVSASIECTLKEFPEINLPFPGPLAPVLAGAITPKIVGSISAGISAGPSVEFKAVREYKKRFLAGYVRNASGTVDRIVLDEPLTKTDDFSVTPKDGGLNANSLGEEGALEVKGGVFLAADVGIRLGGKTVEWLGEFFGEDDLGLIQPITAKVGPELAFKWERLASAVNAKTNGSEATLGLVGEVVFSLGELGGLFDLLTKSVPGFTNPKFEFSLAKATLAKASEPDPTPTITVLNQPTDNVEIDDVVDVELTLTEPAATPALPSEPTGTVWVYRRGGPDEPSYVESDLFRWTTEPGKVTGSKLVDDDACAEFGKGATYVVAIREASFGGAFFYPMYAGEFTISCDQSVEFDPATVNLRKAVGKNTADVTAEQKGYGEDDTLSFELASGSSLPSGHTVTFTPSSIRLDEKTKQVSVRLGCPAEDGEIVQVEYVAQVNGENIDATLPMDLNCTDDFFEINDERIIVPNGGSATMTVSSEGELDDEWMGVARPNHPDAKGYLKGRDTDTEIVDVLSGTIEGRKIKPIPPPGCGGSPGEESLPYEEKTEEARTTTRGGDSVLLVFPEHVGFPPTPGSDCPPPPPGPPSPPGPGGPSGPGGSTGGPGGGGGDTSTGSGRGDPHLTTFDGAAFDSQAIGEYVFTEPLDGSGSPRVVARLDYTGGEPDAFSPTSVIATAVEFDDVTIEMYTRPSFALYIDGIEAQVTSQSTLEPVLDGIDAQIEIASQSTVEVVPGVFVTRVGSAHTVASEDINVRYNGINLQVTVDEIGGFGGMLGTNNANALDDHQIREVGVDPSTWQNVSLADMHAQDVLAREVSESWRIVDPADSPFTVPFDRFDAVQSPRPGSELMAPFRQQAESLLAATAEVCDGTADPDSYVIDYFAIELAIGSDPDLLTCEYVVTGRVLTSDLGVPAVGAEVVVDAPGLTSCITTTDAVGRYTCELLGDVDEAEFVDVTFPLDVTIEASGVGSPTTGVTGIVTFAERASLTSRRSVVAADLVLPIDQAVAIDLTGVLSALGQPVTDPTSFSVTARDAAGGVVADVRLNALPDVGGAYTSPVALPLDTTEVTVEWRYGIEAADHPSADFPGLVAGVNPRTFSPSYDPAIVDVSGTALYNGVAPPTIEIELTGQRSGGGTWQSSVGVTPDGSGAYLLSATLPLDIVSIEAAIVLGDSGNPPITAALASLAPGSNPLTLDASQGAPVLDVTGVAAVNGVPAPDSWFTVEHDGATLSRYVDIDPIDGSFAFSVDLRAGTTAATVTAWIGASTADRPTDTFTGLVDGVNPVVFDGTLAPPVLNLSGVVTGGGVPVDEPFQIGVESDDGGFAAARSVAPDETGAFAVDVELPASATSADVVFRVGLTPADWVTQTFSTPSPGANPHVFDPSFDAVGLDVVGEIKVDGVNATGQRQLRLVAFDATGAQLDTLIEPVDVLGDGSFTEPIQLPVGTDAAEVSALVGPFPYERPVLRYEDLELGSNPAAYVTDAVAPTLQVSGVLTSGGQFVTGFVDFETTVTLARAGGATATLDLLDVANVDGAGSYAFDRRLPETALAAEMSAVVGFEPTQFPTVTVDPVPPGVTAVDLSGDAPLPVTIDVLGVLGDADGLFVGNADIRYVLKEFDGTVIADATTTVTTDAAGQFDLDLETDSTVTEIVLSWLVGIPGEAPVEQTFGGLTPGGNTVAFGDVYDPPVIEIDGVATVNGDPLDDDIAIHIDVTGGSEASVDAAVATDPVTGAYSYVRTLERLASEVDIDLATSDAGNPTLQVTDLALVDGSNPIDGDLAIVRTNLQVSGLMSLAGTVPVGAVDVNVTSMANGFSDQTTTLAVDPDDITGAYSFESLLPHWATSVEVEYEIGLDSSDWPVVVFDTLLGGDDPRVFDAIADVQLFDIDGTFTVGGTPYTREWRLGIRLLDGNGDFLSLENVTIPASPDGSFALDYAPADTAATVELTAYFSFTQNIEQDEQTFTVGGGVNDLDFDPFADTVAVVISGQLLNEGVPDTSARPLTFRFYADGETDYTEWNSATRVPDAQGNYVGVVQEFPADTVRLEVGSRMAGTLENDEIFQSYDLIYGLNELTFDEDYIPLRVTISGNAARDGTPITDDLLFEWTWRQLFPPAGVFSQSRVQWVTPEPNGDYSFTVIGPRLADEIIVEARIGVTEQDFPRTDIEPVTVGADNQVALSFDYDTTEVTISGEIEYDGEIPTSRNIDVYMYDGTGAYLGERNALAVPDPVTGAYTLPDVALASATAEARLTFLFGGFNSQTYEQSTIVVPITPGETTNTATFTFKTTSVELSGNMSTGAGPIANDIRELTIAASDGTTVLDTLVFDEVFTDSSGDYSLTAYLPDGATEVEVTSDVGASTPVTITGLATPGVTVGTADFVGSSTDLTVTGTMTVGGAPPAIPPLVTVREYDDDDFGDGPIYPFEIGSGYAPIPDWTPATGALTASGPLDDDTDFVQIIVQFDGISERYIRFFDVRGLALPLTLDLGPIDHSAQRVEYVADSLIEDLDAGGECFGDFEPFMYDLTLYAFDGTPGDPGTTETTVLTTLVFPNLDTDGFTDPNDMFEVIQAMPPGTVEVVYEISTTNYFPFETAFAEYAYSYAPGTYDYSGIAAVDAFETADCEPFDDGGGGP